MTENEERSLRGRGAAVVDASPSSAGEAEVINGPSLLRRRPKKSRRKRSAAGEVDGGGTARKRRHTHLDF